MDTSLAYYQEPSLDQYTEEDWDAVYEEMLRVSLCLFSRDVLGLTIGPHMLEWGELVETEQRLALIAARGHSKSTFFSYAYPIWRAWAEPGCEVYLFSGTQDQSIEFLDIILYGRSNLKGMIDIPELEHLVPGRYSASRKKGANTRLNKTDVRLTNGSRIRVLGYGKKTRGRHPKYVVLDDVLSDDDMYSQTTRQKNISYLNSAIANLPPPNGQIISVGTPFHAADMWGFLADNPVYTLRKYPGIITDEETGEQRALFPSLWSLEELFKKKQEIGSVAFTREILCQPISDDLSLFPSYLFPPLYDDTQILKPTLKSIRERELSVYAGVDVAFSANVGADYFVIFIIGEDRHGNHYILDIYRNKGIAFHDQLKLIEWHCVRYGVDLCLIESNQAQRLLSDELKRTTNLPIKEFYTRAQNKYPLDRGIPGLRINVENHKTIIPRGDVYSKVVTGIWIEECQQFGFVDGKLQGAGAHDDTVMAWWMATEAAKMGSFSFSVGEEDGDDAAESELLGEDGSEDWESVLLGSDEDDEMPEQDLSSVGVNEALLDPFGI